MKKIILTIFMIMMGAGAAYAKDYTVAIGGMRNTNVSEYLAEGIFAEMEAELKKGGHYECLGEKELTERFWISGDVKDSPDLKKAVVMGRDVGAKKVIVGGIYKEEGVYNLVYHVIDVDTEKMEYRTSARFDSPEESGEAVKKLGENIRTYLENQRYEYQKRTPSGYLLRGLVPGWAQYYHNYDVKGNIFMSAFVGSLIICGGCYYYFDKTREDYRSYKSTSAQPGDKSYYKEYDKKYKRYKDATNYFIWSGALVCLVYTANLVDVFVFSDEMSREISINVGGGPGGIASIGGTGKKGREVVIGISYSF